MSSNIRYLIMDVDGSLTDGKIYIGPSGEAMKAFSVKDGYAINHLLPDNGIIPVIITGRSSEIVSRRCGELGITEVYQGVENKLRMLRTITEDLSKAAYFGDDIPDLDCMKEIISAGGIAGCPADAVSEVRDTCDYVCTQNGGDGALREFVEWLAGMKS